MHTKIHTKLFVMLFMVALASSGCQKEETIEHNVADYNKETDDQPF